MKTFTHNNMKLLKNIELLQLYLVVAADTALETVKAEFQLFYCLMSTYRQRDTSCVRNFHYLSATPWQDSHC
jgi:hypothetical protein